MEPRRPRQAGRPAPRGPSPPSPPRPRRPATPGVSARGFAADLSDARAVRAALAEVCAAMGPPEVLHWNPYNSCRTPLLDMGPGEVDELMGVGVKGEGRGPDAFLVCGGLAGQAY
jgi:NAD(P)-dependent dehydrogenase (short-subunit alcohol dehydrogenase family)